MTGSGIFDDVMSAIGKFLCKIHGVREDHNYSPMFHTLFTSQQHETICDQEVTNLLWTLLEELKDISDSSNVFPKKIKYWMDEKRPTRDMSVQTSHNVELNNSQYVQITCDNNEFNRRIDAFIKRKRAESDAFNRREFCQVITKPNQTSCARTNAVYVPRQSKKSLLKVESVQNNLPDREEEASLNTENMKTWPPTHPSAMLPFNNLSNDIKERINNLNSVLIPNKRITDNADIYTHLKNLEERVLFLESLSPEYFQAQIKTVLENNFSLPTHGDMIEQTNEVNEKENVSLLDLRIKQLQEKLENKAIQLRESQLE